MHAFLFYEGAGHKIAHSEKAVVNNTVLITRVDDAHAREELA